MTDETPSKKRKISAASGFNAACDSNNISDLTGSIPLLPKESKVLLLDIEGCTTAISFVKDVLFPYVTSNLETYLQSHKEEWETLAQTLEQDFKKLPESHLAKVHIEAELEKNTTDEQDKIITIYVQGMVQFDVKAPGLKTLQGKMWNSGYASGELKGHVYADFPYMLKWMNNNNVKVNIYSSGSIAAQKLLFSHSTEGDLCPNFDHHFDITTSGGKKDHTSYLSIAKALNVDPSQICFVSDAEAELVAARKAGYGYVVMSVRAGNAPLTSVGKEFPIIYSLLQICGSD
eukprot:CAMPEP_0197837836 /NCGR_PEP_ID=MMETSP1437-20131217/33457_1 /TAXON_ID=49252 ORGANISM="Eucampia antarctica, Strain CCMP1452" /NCGR_SAMPLE_ID=MMETSP1437 /ASSEMBLY_ACC=CAM_ASM_001096 /LENGTH=288 /DNA_ID=CAMNT_0043445205 /DNA_START=60 /DNA_END=926 /DNA_ORIENTATION=-